MSLRVSQRPTARREFWEIVDFLSEQSVTVAEKFIDAVEATLKFLSDWPGSGSLIEDGSPELAGVRIIQVKLFRNFLVVFRLRDDYVDVLHLTHASRDLQALLHESN
jgi:plasmid stabilization system protein ParE